LKPKFVNPPSVWGIFHALKDSFVCYKATSPI